MPETPNDSVKPKDSASSGVRYIVTPLLLLLGVCLWLNAAQVWPTKLQFEFGLSAGLVGLIPPINRFLARGFERLRNISPTNRTVIALAWTIAAFVYIYVTAVHQGRRFEMVYHDEFEFRLQTVMLAHGRLWMPSHPLGDFFETFYVLSKPVYTAMYYPGTAILNTPSVWLHLQPWVIPLILSATAIGLTYRIAAELLDGAAGCIAALMLLAPPEFRRVAIMNLSQPPALALGLLLIALWLWWRRSPRPRATILMGLCTGLIAITRPIDAICFAVPVGAMMFTELMRAPRRLTRLFAIFLAGVMPFIALQLVFDRGVTGHWLRTPVQEVLARDMPGHAYGIGHTFAPRERPHTALPQKIEFYDNVIVPFLKGDRDGNRAFKWYDQHSREFVPAMLPVALLIVFAPFAFLSRRRAAWVMIGPGLLFLVLYPMYPSFVPHYLFVFMPACGMLVLLGLTSFLDPIRRPQRSASTVALAVLIAMLIAYLPPIDRHVRDVPAYMSYSTLPLIEDKLAELPQRPALIFFRFHPGHDNPQEEPVHNSETLWPDDALVVRAHDLGSRNMELVQYFANKQPRRSIYIFDREDNSLKYIGSTSAFAPATLPTDK